jgi:hypothetical protein
METKPYTIAAKVELAATDEAANKPAPPEAKPAVAESTPKTPEAQPTPAPATEEEDSAAVAESKKTTNWVVLSALIGLGIAAAGFAVYKKSA